MEQASRAGSPRLWNGVTSAARDAIAGMIAAVVLIANIVSFAALMFPGPLAAGAPVALWSMLIGSGLAGLVIAWKTTLPPLASGIDSPTGAVLVVLGATAGPAALAAGASPSAAVQTVMLMFSAASVLTGVLLLALGLARRGALLRFVPYFVSAGFIAATGLLLMIGGFRMSTGIATAAGAGGLTPSAMTKLACALLVLALLLALKRWVKSALALPLTLLFLSLGGSLLLHQFGLAVPGQGWYLASIGALEPWSPFEALRGTAHSLPVGIGVASELVAVAIVALVSLVTKVSSVEIGRKTYGDLDAELRAHGAGTLVAAPFGGLVASLQIGTSSLLEKAGATRRGSGVACAAVMLAVGLLNLDLTSVVPLPVAAGLVFYLGWGFLVESLAKPLARRDLVNVALVLAIALSCVRWGYLVGVLGGIVGACALFALSCARTGVVRQHLSRAQFAGNVGRSDTALRYLAERGEAIQVYWLSGYLFFGSSEGLFERVRHDIEARPSHRVRYVVLDFRMVSGADASGTLSLGKLRNFCDQQQVTLVLSALPPRVHRMLARDGLAGTQGQVPPMADVNVALAWCEDRLLADAPAGTVATGESVFEGWLQEQLGASARAGDLLDYMERRRVEAPTVLYRQGEAADAIDLVADGRLAVDIATGAGQAVRVRTITTHTAVGEMGFFRSGLRSATVSSEGAATLYTLTRPSFERLQRERPDLAMAFVEFLLRTLAERLVVTERMSAALGA